MAGSGGVIAAVPAGSLPMFSRYPEIIPMEACTEDGTISLRPGTGSSKCGRAGSRRL
jgi:hypothetical protein